MSNVQKITKNHLKRSFILFCILLFTGIFLIAQAQTIDILPKGGHVIDYKNNIDGKMDVAISGNKILRVEKE